MGNKNNPPLEWVVFIFSVLELPWTVILIYEDNNYPQISKYQLGNKMLRDSSSSDALVLRMTPGGLSRIIRLRGGVFYYESAGGDVRVGEGFVAVA